MAIINSIGLISFQQTTARTVVSELPASKNLKTTTKVIRGILMQPFYAKVKWMDSWVGYSLCS